MEIYTRKLDLIEDSLKKLSEIKRENPSLDKYRISWKDKDSAERNVQKIVESMVDLGKMLIAEKKLKEPSSNIGKFFISLRKKVSSHLSICNSLIRW